MSARTTAYDRGNRPMLSSVLVVEPYADLRAGIVSVLERRSYTCDAVATPGDAALMLREHDYTYVVVDLDSESPDEFVSSLSPDSNVILLTDDYAGAGQHRLRKPFSRDELLAQFVRR